MDEQTISARRQSVEAAIAAANLQQKADKQAVIRMMAASIYGHLHGDGRKGLIAKSELISESVEVALAIWQEVEEQVT